MSTLRWRSCPGAARTPRSSARRRTPSQSDLARAGLYALALCALCFGSARAERVSCADVTPAPEVIARLPELRTLCRAIVEVSGQRLAVIQGEVSQPLAGEVLEVRFALPTGQTTLPHPLRTAAGTQVRAARGNVAVEELAVGDRLSLLVDIAQPEIALEPAPDQPAVLTALEPPILPPAYSRSAPSGVLWIGGLVLLIGAGGAALQIRRARRSG